VTSLRCKAHKKKRSMNDEEVTCKREGNLILLEAGWRQAQGTNKIAGCSIVLGKKFRMANIPRTWFAPVPGRGLAVRLSGTACDLLVISAKFPPFATGGSSAAYTATRKRLSLWIDALILSAGASCTPIVCTDFNDGVGLRRQGSHHEDAWSTAVGDTKTKEKSHDSAGPLMREVFERHEMVFANTFLGFMPTYYGEEGRTFMIDVVGVPAGFWKSLQTCGVMRRAGKRLQLIPAATNRDHVPVILTCNYCYHLPSEQESTSWNRDTLMAGLTNGECRAEFVGNC
jgi:hypothetical protein